MRFRLRGEQGLLGGPLGWPARVLLLVAALMTAWMLSAPLWTLAFESNQYPEPLRLTIYAAHLEGGKSEARDDLLEINSLNHYIGMKELHGHDFPEFVWLPFAGAALGLLVLRAAALGDRRALADAQMVYLVFAAFSGWSFYRRMYEYGHSLAADAAIKVEPFTPPLFGRVRVANFWVESYPGAGAVAVVLMGVLIGGAWAAGVWWESRAARQREAVPA